MGVISATATASDTGSPTATASGSATASPTPSPSESATASGTGTSTATPTPSGSGTNTSTATPTQTPATGASAVSGILSPRPTTPISDTALLARYTHLPLRFEPNVGQTDPKVRYLAHGPGYTAFFTENQAVIALPSAPRPTPPESC